MASAKQIQQRKLELLEELKEKRNLITGSHLLLRDQVNVSKKLKSSIRQNPKKWFQGGVAAGLGATFLLKRKKKPVVTKSTKGFTLKGYIIDAILKALKPAITSFLTTQLKSYMERKQSSDQTGH